MRGEGGALRARWGVRLVALALVCGVGGAALAPQQAMQAQAADVSQTSDTGASSSAASATGDAAADGETGGYTVEGLMQVEGVSAVSVADRKNSEIMVPETFDMSVDCTACHKKATKRMNKEGYTGSLHASMACVACHDDEAAMTEVHGGSTYNAKKGDRVAALAKTQVNEEICFTCHGSWEDLQAATADSTVLIDNNGTIVSPHNLPTVENHVAITCGSCHKMHDDVEIDESAQNACLTCHHDNVYECGTCHAV